MHPAIKMAKEYTAGAFTNWEHKARQREQLGPSDLISFDRRLVISIGILCYIFFC